MLYTPKDDFTEDMNILDELESRGEEHPVFRRRREPKIAGLEAVNFIALASPHLGVRGNKQVRKFLFTDEEIMFMSMFPYAKFFNALSSSCWSLEHEGDWTQS